jgi:hypothetical protein
LPHGAGGVRLPARGVWWLGHHGGGCGCAAALGYTYGSLAAGEYSIFKELRQPGCFDCPRFASLLQAASRWCEISGPGTSILGAIGTGAGLLGAGEKTNSGGGAEGWGLGAGG